MSKRVNLKAVQFSSAGDTIDIADSDNLSFTDGAGTDKPFSITAWVYVGDITTDSGVIISRRNNAGAGDAKGEWIVGHTNGGLYAILYADPAQNVAGSFSTGNRIYFLDTGTKLSSATWHLVTVTYDGTQNASGLKVYKDAVAISPNIATAKVDYAGMPNFDIVTTIGGTDSPTGNTFDDYIADTAVFNKALSSTEVTEIYNGGKVKDLSKASVYNDIISWWKMGDDLDATGGSGIKDYVGSNNGTLAGASSIVTVPALGTDRIYNNGVMVPSSWGRTRQPKNVAGDHQVYIHGGVAGNMPTADPSGAAAGYVTENQRYLHFYWKAASTTAAVTAYGYSHASGLWSQVYDKSGTQVKLSTTTAAIDTYRVFEIDGVDKVYFKQSGTALATTDLFAAAMSSF
mgnify:CR=1 FL=1